MSRDDLRNALTRYEGAVSACEREGDDSEEAVAELESAREALLDILHAALEKAR